MADKRNWTRSFWFKYVLTALATVAFVVVLAFVYERTTLPITLWLLLPVVVSAYYGGFGPGLLAAVLGVAIFQNYTLSPPSMSVYNRWVLYLLLSAAISLLNERLHRARRKIEASELSYAVTLSSITDAVITTDPDGRITFLNPAAARLGECDAVAVRGREFTDIFAIKSESSKSPLELLTQPLRGDTIHLNEDCYLRSSSGAMLPIEVTLSPIRDRGRTTGVLFTLRDRTEQRKTEEALRERLALQERLYSIAEMLPGALHAMHFSAEGAMTLQYASPNFAEIRGYDPAPLQHDASNLQASVHPDDLPLVRECVLRSLRDLQPMHVEYRAHHPAKGMIWFELFGMPQREPGGTTLINAIVFDVTQRKQVEEQLRASQALLRAALDAGEMGILQIDLASGVVELDASSRKLWGLPADADSEATLDTLLCAVHAEDRERFEHEYRAAVAKRQSFRTECRILHEGNIRWLAFHGRIEHSPSAQRLMGLIHDITFRKHAEESRLRSQKLEALGVLAGGIAHDFNNLLLAIGGNAKLAIQDLPAEHPTQTSLHEISKASARAAMLVRQILTFSQTQERRCEALALQPVLDEVIGQVRAIVAETIELRPVICGHVPLVAADGGQVHQALLNLLTNAADAVDKAGGRIEVRLETMEVDAELAARVVDLHPGSYVRVTVTDNGGGMDAVTLQRIFDPFFTTKRKGQGTGLGLAIVHGIMKGNHGALSVASTLGSGSVFELYFPVADGQPTALAAAPSQIAARSAHILYVDDEEPLVFLMIRSLQRLQHSVEGFTDPNEALNVFRTRPGDFDLVVSDMAMPGMSGFEFAAAVLAVRPDTPVVITSGYLRPEDHERAKQLGIRELVLKPDTVDELSQIVIRCNEAADQPSVTCSGSLTKKP